MIIMVIMYTILKVTLFLLLSLFLLLYLLRFFRLYFSPFLYLLPLPRVALCAQVFSSALFIIVPYRARRFTFARSAVLPTQRHQLFVITIHAQISALGGFTLQPTPARSIGGTRHAHFYAQHRPFAIVTSMAQIHSFFDVRAIPPRGGFLRSARGARFHS